MLDINLGNKTLVVGVLVALILAYGMVNFDSGNSGARGHSWNATAQQTAAPTPATEIDAIAQAEKQAPVVDESTLNHWERKELKRQKNL